MKRYSLFLVCLLSFVIVISVFPAMPAMAVTPHEGDEMLVDGSFEEEHTYYNAGSAQRRLKYWFAFPEHNGVSNAQGVYGPYVKEMLISDDAANTEYVHSGDRGIRLSYDDSYYEGTDPDNNLRNPYIGQTVAVHPGTTYTMGAWVKVPDITDDVLNVTNGKMSGYLRWYFNGVLTGETIRYTTAHVAGDETRELDAEGWYYYSIDYEIPDDITTLTVCLRLISSGTVYVDDLTMKVKNVPERVNIDTDWRFYYSDQENINISGVTSLFYDDYIPSYARISLINGTIKEGKAEGFYGPYLTEEANEVRTGGRSIKMASATGGINPRIEQDFVFQEGKTYDVSAYIKIPSGTNAEYGITDGALVSGNIKFYGTYIANTGAAVFGETITSTGGDWYRYSATYSVGAGETVYRTLGLKLEGIGLVYVDDFDVRLNNITRIRNGSFETILESGYYEDSQYRNLSGWNAYPENDGVPIITSFIKPVRSWDEENNLVKTKTHNTMTAVHTLNNVPITDNKLSASIPVSLLDKEEEYTIKTEVFASDGTLVDTSYNYVTKYDRPASLPEPGKFFHDDNGDRIYSADEQFMPIIGYHVSASARDFAACRQAGINVIQNVNAEAYNNYGIMGLQVLYTTDLKTGTQKAAGDTEPAYIRNNSGYFASSVAENTIQTIKSLKDSPALFAYALVDEPNQNDVSEREMENAYELVRSLDNVHPIYIVESERNSFRFTCKYVDILATNPYTETTTGVYHNVLRASEISENVKTVCAILMTYMQAGSDYYPSGDAIRHQIYSALLGGAAMMGFYTISDGYNHYSKAQYGGTTAPIYNVNFEGDDLWEKLLSFNNNEKGKVYYHFTNMHNALDTENTEGNMQYSPSTRTGTDQEIKYGYSDAVRWHSWTNGDENYLLIMNQSTTSSATVTVSASVVNSDSYIATIAGYDNQNIATADGAFTATLPAYGVGLYRVYDTMPIEPSVELVSLSPESVAHPYKHLANMRFFFSMTKIGEPVVSSYGAYIVPWEIFNGGDLSSAVIASYDAAQNAISSGDMFTADLNNIPLKYYGTAIYALPFASMGGEYVYGTGVSTSVNESNIR